MNRSDLEKFSTDCEYLAEDIQYTIEQALINTRTQALINRPVENTAKCKTLLSDIDPRLFNKLDEEEKQILAADLEELSRLANSFRKILLG